MEKFLKKYGVVILLYLVIVCGVLSLNARFKMLNQTEGTKINFSR